MGVDLDSGDPRGDFSQFVTILQLKPFDSILFLRDLLHALLKPLDNYINMALMSNSMLSSSIHFLFLYIC